MDFRILGPVEAREQGEPVALGGRRQRALLALLLLHANIPLTTERLIDELWGDEPPASGSAAIQNRIARLRRAIGPDRVLTQGSGYTLRVAEGELDLQRVQACVERAAESDAEGRATVLREALREWRGTPLADVGGTGFAAAEAVRLRDLRLSVLEERITADLELGRHAEVVGELATLAAQEPLHEGIRAHLILALYRCGRQAEALDAYRETRRLLVDELGLEPGPGLKQLELAILRQDPLLDAPPPLPAQAPGLRERRSARLVLGAAAGGLALALSGGLAAYALTSGSPRTALGAPSTGARAIRRANAAIGPAGVQSRVAATTERTGGSRASTRATGTGRRLPTVPALVPAAPVTSRVEPTTTRAATAATFVPKREPPARPAPPTSSTTAPRPTTAPTTTSTTTRGPAAIVRITDDFSKDYRDGTIWHQVVTGTSVQIGPAAGRLVVSIGGDAVPGGPYDVIDGHYGTQCSFPADFDARLDFELIDWPESAGVSVGLWAFFANAAVVRQNGSDSGEAYSAWVVPVNGTTSLPDRSGSLRLTRVDGTITASFLHDGSWRELARGQDRGTAVLGPSAQGTPAFGHAPVKVAFDNFSVEARELLCPPGSRPPVG